MSGLKGVLASWNTIDTMSLPMCRFRWSCWGVCLGEVDEGADDVVLLVDALLPRLAKLSRLTQCPIISRNLSSAGEWHRLPTSASSLVCPTRW